MQPADFQIVELGDPRLRALAKPVAEAQMGYALEVAEAMAYWMNERGGVGIAAPQIGVPLQMMIIASRPSPRYPDAPSMAPLLMLNPETQHFSDCEVTLWEGCLSVPGLRGRVTRPDGVTVQFSDRDGQSRLMELTGFPARIFLHEYDHLIGKTFVDRVDSVHDLVTDKVYFEQIARVTPPPAP
ncbi:MAG: peptide deformylase [Pseudomonadota bacterium]|nr:peptide deformylase [Pseudomonadota bacterium]